MAITLLQLRVQSRQRADQEKSKFVSDTELNGYINNSIAELHDLLLEAYGSEYGVGEPFSFTTINNQSRYDLPEDFYELKGVDAQLLGSQWFPVKRFQFKQRNRLQGLSGWSVLGFPEVEYRIVGNTLMLSPPPDANSNIRVWYVPVATKLVADEDTLDDLNAYSEYVIVDAAIKCMQKEESDVSVLMVQKEALKKRIVDKAGNRDAGSPDSVTDVYSIWDDEEY